MPNRPQSDSNWAIIVRSGATTRHMVPDEMIRDGMHRWMTDYRWVDMWCTDGWQMKWDEMRCTDGWQMRWDGMHRWMTYDRCRMIGDRWQDSDRWQESDRWAQWRMHCAPSGQSDAATTCGQLLPMPVGIAARTCLFWPGSVRLAKMSSCQGYCITIKYRVFRFSCIYITLH